MFLSAIGRFLVAAFGPNSLKSLALFLVALLCAGRPAAAQSFSNLYFFGDSGTDNGVYTPIVRAINADPVLRGAFEKQFGTLPSLATGIPTTTPGLMWSEALGQKFGVAVKPASAAFTDYVANNLAASVGFPAGALSGIGSAGNNYAASGAGVATNAPGVAFAWFGKYQIAAYLASTGNLADPNALYTVLIGANDFASNLDALSKSPSDLQALAKGASDLAVTLKNAGARYILVPNIANRESTDAVYRAVLDKPPPFERAAYGAAYAAYSANVWANLAASNVNFIPADSVALFNYVVTNPSPFGITEVRQIVAACGLKTAEDCTPADWRTPNADKTYLFADSGAMHFTSAYQQIEADYVYNLLAAPGQISLMPVAQLRSRLGVIEAIRSQMPDRARNLGERHVWISGDVAALRSGELLDAQPGKNLRPMSVAVGVDYQIRPCGWRASAPPSGGPTSPSRWAATSVRTIWPPVSMWASGRPRSG